MSGWFITGTDTGVGKTGVACALLDACARRGYASVGMKPVASGCKPTAQGLRSDDALALTAAGNVAAGYDEINPFAFAPATAPHLAAAAAGVDISPERILTCFRQLRARARIMVVEGIGGWLTPIGAHTTMADVAARLGLPVILVVGVRLGCLNHALLTVAAVERSGLALAGWVENRIAPDPQRELADYSRALAERIGAPRLGAVPFFTQEQPVVAWADCLDQAVLRRLFGHNQRDLQG